MVKLFLTVVTRLFNGERTVLSTNGAKKSYMQKNEIGLLPNSIYKNE